MTRRRVGLVLLVAAVSALAACDRVYYGTMKKFGYEKRDILIGRVREARKAQSEAQEEFKSALDRFREVVGTEGGSLEDKYEKLNRELQRSEDRAKSVHDRVKAVHDVAEDLFKEWEKELAQVQEPRDARRERARTARHPQAH